MLFDTHTHLHFDKFDADREDVITRARAAGVAGMITLGTDLRSSRESLAIAQAHDGIFAAAGIHPSDAHRAQEGDAAALRKLILAEENIVAVGEIGLDFYWETRHHEAQYHIFGEMLRMAQEIGYPVVIHNRNARREMTWFFQEQGIEQLDGQMHCFAGDVAEARFYLDMGLHVSFTANITYPDAPEAPVARFVPLDRLLLETDSPFMPPLQHKKQRNEPAFVVHVAEQLAEIHGVPVEKIADITTANARRLFGV